MQLIFLPNSVMLWDKDHKLIMANKIAKDKQKSKFEMFLVLQE